MLEFDRIDISEGINVNKLDGYLNQKNVIFVIIGILLIKILTIKNIFVMDVMI